MFNKYNPPITIKINSRGFILLKIGFLNVIKPFFRIIHNIFTLWKLITSKKLSIFSKLSNQQSKNTFRTFCFSCKSFKLLFFYSFVLSLFTHSRWLVRLTSYYLLEASKTKPLITFFLYKVKGKLCFFVRNYENASCNYSKERKSERKHDLRLQTFLVFILELLQYRAVLPFLQSIRSAAVLILSFSSKFWAYLCSVPTVHCGSHPLHIKQISIAKIGRLAACIKNKTPATFTGIAGAPNLEYV